MPLKDPEARRAWEKAYHLANRARKLAIAKAHYAANRESKLAYAVDYGKAYRKANPDKVRAACGRARARRLSATPPWADIEELDSIWRACPEGHHVDHIHPLRGELSCGLNVPWNLQYLPADMNKSKGNRMPPPGYLDWFGHDKEHSVWPH